MSSATPPPSTYRLAAAVRARVLGGVLVGLGVLVALVAVLVWAFALPGTVLTIAVVLAVGVVVLSGLAAPLVTLDEVGYRVRFLRGAGVVSARWPEVEDVVTATVAGDDCVVLRLRDGRTTTIPVAVLDVPRQDFVRDLGEHLHRGHGYRPVR